MLLEAAECGGLDCLRGGGVMPKVSNAAKLAEVQGKAVDALLAKARRIVKQVRVSESAGEERMGQLLDVAGKLAPLNASEEAMAEYWGLVEVAQSQLELCALRSVSATSRTWRLSCRPGLSSRTAEWWMAPWRPLIWPGRCKTTRTNPLKRRSNLWTRVRVPPPPPNAH